MSGNYVGFPGHSIAPPSPSSGRGTDLRSRTRPCRPLARPGPSHMPRRSVAGEPQNTWNSSGDDIGQPKEKGIIRR